jgi:glycosyl hydrolase family 15
VVTLDRIGVDAEPAGCSGTEAEDLFRATVTYWRRWLSASRYRGRWREMVHRSALTLKLLTYAPTGAIVAAPTTSLPGQPAGERNWDYRFVWIRDAAFCVYALPLLGFTNEAASMNFLAQHIPPLGDHPSGPLQICTASTAAPTWSAARSRPVRSVGVDPSGGDRRLPWRAHPQLHGRTRPRGAAHGAPGSAAGPLLPGPRECRQSPAAEPVL